MRIFFCVLKERNMVLGEKIIISSGGSNVDIDGSDVSDSGCDDDDG